MDSAAPLVARLRAAGCVYAEEEAALLLEAAPDATVLDALVARRVAGEPLELVLGWAEFLGLRLEVAPGVFVPRRRTELLARAAISRLPRHSTLVELCCGVAPVAAAVAAADATVQVWAVDVDPVAVAIAGRNVATGSVSCGDLFEPLPHDLRGQVGVLAANTPYVPTDEVAFLPAEARQHEPAHTLDGGPDGLALLRRIAAEARQWLAPGGCLLVEVSERQLPAAQEAFRTGGLDTGQEHDENLDAWVVTGQRG